VDTLGVKFYIFINPFVNGGVDSVILKEGEWENSISKVIKARVNQDSVFVDVGANIGYYSLFAAAVMNGGGRVLAFVPIAHLCGQIKKSLEKNNFKNVELFQAALSNVDGKTELGIVDENIGASGLKRSSESVPVKKIIEVTLSRLDSFEVLIDRIDLVKIDVEGNELEVLQGAKNTIEKFLPDLIIEYSPVIYEAERVGKSLEMINWLQDNNYIIQDLEGNQLDLIKEYHFNNLEQKDIFCTVNN
jgi:FkbM family methyltransferase